MLSLARYNKQVILDDLDVFAQLGRWRPTCSKAPLLAAPEPLLWYERRSETQHLKTTAVAIVKNESKVICRMLQSMVPWTQGCIILDTGSTDDTMDCIKRFMECHDWTGKVYSWPLPTLEFDFKKTRNAVVRLASCWGKWLILTDADYIWQCTKSTFLDDCPFDVLQIGTSNGCVHFRPHVVKSDVLFKYVRRTHEYVEWNQTALKTGETKFLKLNDVGDGGCKADKLLRDIPLLKMDMKEYGEDKDTRSWFYYALTLQGLNRNQIALEAFNKRIHMRDGHWNQEIFVSMYRAAQISKGLGHPTWLRDMLEAFLHTPKRLEPLCFAVQYLFEQGEFRLAASLGALGYWNENPSGRNMLFVSDEVHDKHFWHGLASAMLKVDDYVMPGFAIVRRKISSGKAFSGTELLHSYLDRLKSIKEDKKPLVSYEMGKSLTAAKKVDEATSVYKRLVGKWDDETQWRTACFGEMEKDKLVDWENCIPRETGAEEQRIASALWMAKTLKTPKTLDWLGYTLDALKLAAGTKYLAQVNYFLSEHLRYTSMEYLIGPLLRIGLVVREN